MSTFIAVRLDLEIHDSVAFAAAAVVRAIEEGEDEEDAARIYTADNLASCAVMLFDPGTGPAGCEITNGSAEEFVL